MPILGGPSDVIVIPQGPVVLRSEAQPVPLQVTYIDPDGNSWFLSDPTVQHGYVCTDIVGLAGPPVSFTSIPLPAPAGGALPQLYMNQVKTILVGIFVESLNGAAGQDDYLTMLDKVSTAFYNLRGGLLVPGTLVVQRPDGSSRQISVICTSGPDQPDDSPDNSGVLWTTYAMTLQACDPVWSDTTAQDTSFSTAPSGATGILPLLPISLGGITSLGNTTVTNSGTADAYPPWTITGPGTVSFANNTTGRSFGLATALTIGQQVQVNTQPGNQGAIDLGSGNSLWSDLVQSSPRDLWPLVPGDNLVNISMAGNGSGTNVDLMYSRRWLRA